MPSLTFIATANAVSYTGAIPHFVDVDPKTMGVCTEKLDSYLEEISYIDADGYCYNKVTGRRISGLVIVHILGHVADITPLMEVAKKYHLAVIEDAAEALGSYRDNQHAGTFAPLSAFSFNGNKILTTGGGGMLVTNDEHLAKQAKHLTTTARSQRSYRIAHDEIAYNYRLPNLNAALGCAQLEQVSTFLTAKRTLAHRYAEAFSSIEGVSFFTEPSNCKSNYWLNAIILDGESDALVDEILAITNENGIMTRPLWELIHTLPMYRSCPKADLSESVSLMKRVLCLPSSPQLVLEPTSE
jgi:perosamine synthetase